MSLPIENWLSEQTGLDADAEALFREGVAAYRANAYRAALLLSYLGFLTLVKSRIIRAAPIPPGVAEANWTALQRELRNDEQWDPAAFRATQQKNQPIFPVPDDLRAQVSYWRDRRNDCAHAKTRNIGHPHVEAFWAFIIGDSAKFCIVDGPDDLLVDIERHYNPSHVAPGTPCDHLVARLPGAVAVQDFPNFLIELRTRLVKFGMNHHLFNFLDGIIKITPAPYRDEVIHFISQDRRMFGDFAVLYPARISEFTAHPTLIRYLWHDRLCSGYESALPLFAQLLRANQIPSSEREEAVARVVERVKGEVPNNNDVDVLEQNGFFAKLRSDAFTNSRIDRFDWANPKANIIAWTLGRFGLDQAAVTTICNLFRNDCNFARDVRDELNKLFRANPGRASEFRELMKQHGLSPPTAIESLC